MARPIKPSAEKSAQPSNIELQALCVLWHEGPSTVTAVLDGLVDGRERAYTTVLSVMQSLERKGLVRKARAGRAHVFEAAVPMDGIVSRAAREFVTNAFGGRAGEAVLTILSTGTLSPDEKMNIERELQRTNTMAAKKTAKKTAAKSANKAVKKVAQKAPAKKAAAKKAAGNAAPKAPAKKTATKKAAAKAVKKVAKSAGTAPAKTAPKPVAKKAAPVKKAAAKKTAKKAAKK